MNPKEIKINTKGRKDFDEDFIVETFKEDQECEQCGKMGSYIIEGDPAVIGFCMKHIEKSYGKNNIEVLKN